MVGARIFGLSIDDVPHLKIAYERGLGEGDLTKINVIGKNLNEYTEKYDFDLLQEFPESVKIIKGKELLCREGCKNNPLIFLQILAYDYPKKFKGGWFLIMGKGHDENIVKQLRDEGYTKGLVAGFCAIDEVGEQLRNAFGKKNVFYSRHCNTLHQTTSAMLKLSGVSAFDFSKGYISNLEGIKVLLLAKLHRSKALMTSVF